MRRLILVLMLCMMMTSVSAFDFDNTKIFNADEGKYGTYEIRDSFVKDLFGFAKKIAELELKENTAVCGEDCYMITNINITEKSRLINGVRFYRLDNNWGLLGGLPRGYELYYLNNSSWIKFNITDEFDKGMYKIKLIGHKKPSWIVDWQINVQGIWTEEWSVWGNISEGDDSEVVLISPDNQESFLQTEVTFNCSAEVTDTSISIANLSLWTNQSGTWTLNETLVALDISDSLTSYYAFDETSGTVGADYVGGKNLTHNSGVLVNQSGKNNRAVYYDGINDYSSVSAFQDTPATITWAGWIYWDGVTGGTEDTIIYSNSSAGAGEIVRILEDGGLYYQFATSSGVAKTWTTADSSLPINEWFHFAITNNGSVSESSTKIYINGDEEDIATHEGSATGRPTGIQNLRIGKDFNPNGFFEGYLDELGVWARVLNSTEIEDLYLHHGKPVDSFLIAQFTKDYHGGADILWNCLACDTDGDCGLAETNRTFSITTTPLIINSETFNTTTYETSYETYVVNVTSNSSLTSVALLFNDTSYSMTNQGSGIWSYARDIPSSVVGDNSIKFKYTYVGNLINSTESTQTISSAIFTLCNSTYTNDYLNITFKNEGNLSLISAIVTDSTFEYYLGSGTEKKEYTFTNSTANSNYAFCVSPNLTMNVDSSFQYSASGYPQRTWNPSYTEYTYSVTDQILYLLSSADGLYVTFQVTNPSNQVLSGVSVVATRVISGDTVIVGQGTTGADGAVTFWLNPDYSHTINFSKVGFDTESFSITPTQSEYTVILSGGTSEQIYDYTKGITIRIKPEASTQIFNDTIYNFNMTISTSYWDLERFGFELKLANGTILNSSNSSSSSGGTVWTNINTTDYKRILMYYYWTINSTNMTRIASWNIINSFNTNSEWSIKAFFEDFEDYIDSGIFGLDNFGRNLIVFLVLFITVGILTYKYGVTSPRVAVLILFGIVYLFDVGLGFLPTPVNVIPNFFTWITGLITAVIFIREGIRA